jgi:hypothetical protein
MTVELKPVKSSAVNAIGHDPATNSLHVEYASGARYVYDGVTADHHRAVVGFGSVGKNLNSLVKALGSPGRKVA